MRNYILPLALTLAAISTNEANADSRELVSLPSMMQDHMLGNMRDHLATMNEILAALAAGKLDQAADIAESRLGMSSLQSHGAAHLASMMPKPMQEMGTNMHRAASRFARTAQEAKVEDGLERTLGALSELTQQCMACHAQYRIK